MGNFSKHIKTVNKHRFLVFILCFKSGIPFRGLVHDLSKYSKTELSESIKYYNGKNSPIINCRKENGYSICWLHHKAKNKHHFEYWYDEASPNIAIMPYKYAVEMICDRTAASMTYKGTKYTDSDPYDYFLIENKRFSYMINPKINKFMETVFLDLKEKGHNYVFNRKYFKRTYTKIVGDNK